MNTRIRSEKRKAVPLACAALWLAAMTAAGDADARFRISEEQDEFTKTSYLVGDGLKLCQPKSAGFAAMCATLQLVWRPSEPEVVGIRLEQRGIQNIDRIAVNIGGEISTYGASVATTDFNYEQVLSQLSTVMAWSSANAFVLPVSALEGICADEANGVIRVTGTHEVTDYDFYRKARGKGVPADELAEFLDAIADQ